jgi:hypothetical protein
MEWPGRNYLNSFIDGGGISLALRLNAPSDIAVATGTAPRPMAFNPLLP